MPFCLKRQQVSESNLNLLKMPPSQPLPPKENALFKRILVSLIKLDFDACNSNEYPNFDWFKMLGTQSKYVKYSSRQKGNYSMMYVLFNLILRFSIAAWWHIHYITLVQCDLTFGAGISWVIWGSLARTSLQDSSMNK